MNGWVLSISDHSETPQKAHQQHVKCTLLIIWWNTHYSSDQISGWGLSTDLHNGIVIQSTHGLKSITNSLVTTLKRLPSVHQHVSWEHRSFSVTPNTLLDGDCLLSPAVCWLIKAICNWNPLSNQDSPILWGGASIKVADLKIYLYIL